MFFTVRPESPAYMPNLEEACELFTSTAATGVAEIPPEDPADAFTVSFMTCSA